jgi:EAL domain-containing protein (putative c-di-GMP-specific phosphodiesterase class I)
MTVNRLLVIDDDPDICGIISRVARGMDYAVKSTTHFNDFKRLYRKFNPTIVVTDLAMPGIDGIELLRFLRSQKSKAELILISGMDGKVLKSAKRVGEEHGLNMKGVLQKPIMIEELESLLAAPIRFPGSITTHELDEAISNGQLLTVYQPKVTLQSTDNGTVREVEGLVRWQHPVYGLLTPDKFLSTIEETGLLLPLTMAVVTEVCRQIRRWRELGQSVCVAVNLGPQLLTDLSLPDEIAALVKRNGVETTQIIIEITESGVMEDPVRAMDILTRFRLKGFRLSLDDFGTGFSSLVHLFRMPFVELKIDQSFIREVGTSEEARVIVRATTEMAHRLNLTVCAEGVESEDDLNFLTLTGCDKAQGYYISRPLDGTNLTDFMSARNRRPESIREQA